VVAVIVLGDHRPIGFRSVVIQPQIGVGGEVVASGVAVAVDVDGLRLRDCKRPL